MEKQDIMPRKTHRFREGVISVQLANVLASRGLEAKRRE